jgi:hypothetical protein
MMKWLGRSGVFLGGALAGAVALGGGLALATPRAIGPLAVPGAPPAGLRAALAETCPGYNAALIEAAALSRRINKPQEATRLLQMRQDCNAQGAGSLFRSSR